MAVDFWKNWYPIRTWDFFLIVACLLFLFFFFFHMLPYSLINFTYRMDWKQLKWARLELDSVTVDKEVTFPLIYLWVYSSTFSYSFTFFFFIKDQDSNRLLGLGVEKRNVGWRSKDNCQNTFIGNFVCINYKPVVLFTWLYWNHVSILSTCLDKKI